MLIKDMFKPYTKIAKIAISTQSKRRKNRHNSVHDALKGPSIALISGVQRQKKPATFGAGSARSWSKTCR